MNSAVRLVMKQEMVSLSARAEIAKRGGGRRKHASVGQCMAGSLMGTRVPALHVPAVTKPQKAYRSAPLSWEEHVSLIPSGILTAWCADLATLQASIFAGASLIVIPRRGAGVALSDAAAAKLEDVVSFTRVNCTAPNPLSVRQLITAVAGEDIADDAGADRKVAQVLAKRGQDSHHLVITVDRADNLSPEALAFLQRLTEIHTPGAASIQVVFAGGPPFYALLANERFDVIREDVRSEVGHDFVYDPNAPEVTPMTGSQRAGVATGLLVVLCLVTGPLVPWGSLPSFKGQAPVATMAPVRMFRSDLARHQVPTTHPGIRPVDRHV